MKRCYNLLIPLLVGFSAHAQVGINTDTPKATVDIRANSNPNYPDGVIPPRATGDALKAKEAAYGTDQNGAIITVSSGITSTTGAAKTLGVTSPGDYVYEASTLNTTGQPGLWVKISTTSLMDGTYSAKYSGNLSLIGLSLTILGGQKYLPYTADTTTYVNAFVSSSSMNSSGIYTIPQTGVYKIDYSYIESGALSASLLSGSSINIFKNGSLLDSNSFSLLSTSLTTQARLNQAYYLQAGDQLRFGIDRATVLSIDLLTAVNSTLTINKIR